MVFQQNQKHQIFNVKVSHRNINKCKLKSFFFIVFPPLSLAALKEYRPTLTAKSSSASTIYSRKQQQQQQQRQKTDFIWEQSIVSPKDE
jgi:hypothetical protein